MSLGLEEMLQNNFFYAIPVLVFNNKLAYLVFGHEKHSRYWKRDALCSSNNITNNN